MNAIPDLFRPLLDRITRTEQRLRFLPHFEWGTITSVAPLAVRLDADAGPLDGVPSTLIVGLRVGDRVRVEIQNRRATIVGRGGGDPPLANNTLWTGVYHLSGTQNANLSQPVSAQRTGIVLVWSAYASGAANDWNFNTTFVPKQFVADQSGFMQQQLGTAGAVKNFYVRDTQIQGRAGNETSPNSAFVLRSVYGV